jgi:polysaccharide export outer membrane protein
LKKTFFRLAFFYVVVSLLVTACSSYKQNIMFQVPEGHALQQQVQAAEQNYIIQKYDYLEAEVLTNKGEKIIDPEFQRATDQGSQSVVSKPAYLIDNNGVGKFPMIGELKLEGLTLRQAEEILQQAYAKFYSDAYVILKYLNKRVIVLGSPGGQVIPLTNENMKLVEVLALAKGLGNDAKSHNIRVLRGDQLFVVDLSTFDGYLKNNLLIQSGDIVYVEPVRRVLTESVRDYIPILSALTAITTLVVVLISQ